MKKLRKFLNLFFIGLTLCSCFGAQDTKIADIKGIVWKEETFHIVASSDQLNERGGYSSLIVDEKKYNCVLYLANRGFGINLFDNEGKITYFYGTANSFLNGNYGNLKKEVDKAYIYSLPITLINESSQYSDYCVANNISFPESMTLYGYAAS